MFWPLFCLCGVALVVAAIWIWRNWMRPWRDLEAVVQDVIHARKPGTFLVTGNRCAERIGIALEDVFLRQRDLATRAAEGELNVRTILGAMHDGLAVVDTDFCVRLLNASSREMFSVADEHFGQNVMETFRNAQVGELVGETLRTGETATGAMNLRSRSQAVERRVAITSFPMREEDGAMHGAVVLFQDVTHLQQLEQVRRDFVSNVSHELRTPLSIFQGYLETLLDEPDLEAEERERILRVLAKHSTRLNSLVEDLLSLARLEAPDPRLKLVPLSLQEFLPRIAKDWQKKAAAKEIKIVQEIDADLPLIEADEARLEEIIYNLLDNALKYSNAGGQVTIRAAHEQPYNVSISVIDTGTGIASSDLPRIFERFYRADKARSRELGGTGLGLAIVKHIAQLHGGSVTAESDVGHGTTVRVLLPVRQVRAEKDEFTET